MAEDRSFAAVMHRLRAGDEAAAADVFHRFPNRLIALARTHLHGRLRQKVDPEDVLQSVYKSFFLRHAQGQLNPQGWDSLWSLLTVITVRKCGRWRERFHAGRRDVGDEVALQPPAGESGSGWEAMAGDPSPSEVAVLTEMVEALRRGLEGRDRDIVALTLQGYTASEISTQLGRPERTVYRVLGRVKKRLQRLGASAAEAD
jgi:RNA polymerase sigma-70 factor (ECF subfamily)